MSRQVCTLKVNGCEHHAVVRPHELLLDVLRDELNLTGTKRGCDMGTCGCCTILIDGQPRASCLVMALEAEGKEITTIEGLRDSPLLTPLQDAYVKAGASQCGFCSPGFLMTATCLLREEPNADEETIREAISGNMCRCTGYVKIVDAIQDAIVQTASGDTDEKAEA